MGLDSYFRFFAAPGETAPTVDMKVNLVGGMFSGHDNGSSFRGKVYDSIVTEATGGEHSLYHEIQSPGTVREIGHALIHFLDTQPDRQTFGDYETPREQVLDLARVFRHYGDLNFGLMGWW